MRTDPQRPKQQSAESSREILAAAFSIYHKCQERAFLFAILSIIRNFLTFNNQTVVIMNIDKLLNDAVKVHNLTNPDIIIRKSQCDTLSWYFLYCKDSNIWDTEECRLYMYLFEKLSQERIFPFICLRKVDGEDKIGIFIDVNTEL